jgi:hypothetical protein
LLSVCRSNLTQERSTQEYEFLAKISSPLASRAVSRVADERPSLEGRTMRCTYATGRDGKGHQPATVPSRWGAAFFEYRPDKATDRYYCGCWGWD